MIDDCMINSSLMQALIAKRQLDAECAADNAASAEEADNARIWPVLAGLCPFVPLGYNRGKEICCWSHAYRMVVSLKKLTNTFGDVVRIAPIEQLTEWINKKYNMSPPFPG
ncbi:MAG: hypothetical protein ACI4OX_05510 [Akkermansia sp.]